MYKLYYENIYYFPIVERAKYVLITPANLKNVPRSGQAIAGNMYVEQSFFAK